MKSFNVFISLCVAGTVLVSCQDGEKSKLASQTAGQVVNESLASQGGESSGGGGGFYCADQNTAEVLDIWEGRLPQMYNYTISDSTADLKTQLNRALANLNLLSPIMANLTKQNIESLMVNATAVDANTELPFPQDALPLFVKPNCRLRGIMYYDGDRKILWYDQFMKSRLSKTDEAAIWFHEGLYKALRDNFGETDSKATRQVVACSFSSAGCRNKLLTLEQLLPADVPVYRCYNELSTYFYFQALGSLKLSLVLSRSNGQELNYPWHWSESGYSMPNLPSANGISMRESGYDSGFSPKTDITFQGFEKTNFAARVGLIRYVNRGGLLPIGLTAPFSNPREDLFGASLAYTTCEKANQVPDPVILPPPVSGDPTHPIHPPISGDPTYPISGDPTHPPLHPPASSDPTHPPTSGDHTKPITNGFVSTGTYSF